MLELIVEADGGSRGNPGPAGYGSVVRDAATGATLAEVAEYIGVATNNVAEYRGLVAGLTAARQIDGGARVRVRMDSKLVVEQMSGRWKIKHPAMKPLAAQAAEIFPAAQVSYEWVPRERNKHADRLANEAMDAGKQGRPWKPSQPTRRATSASDSGSTPAPGPPGDATAGAALARAALARSRSGAASAAPRRRGAAGEGEDERTGGAESHPGPAAGQSIPPVDQRNRSAGQSIPSAEQRNSSAGPSIPSAGRTALPSADDQAALKSAADRRAARSMAGAGGSTRAGTAPGQAAPKQRGAAGAARQAHTAPSGWAADLGTPATFVLLRHGETPLTPEKRFSGSGGTDPSLAPAGRAQAERTAAALAARGTIQAVVSSPLRRCRETAAVVAARLDLPVAIESDLRETDFGAWEGMTFAEVRARHPEDLDAWLALPTAAPTGGGESFEEVAGRVAAARDKLLAAHAGRTVLLVTHVTPVKTLVRLALGAPPESVFRMELSAASLSAIAYYADGNASLRLLNETAHLR